MAAPIPATFDAHDGSIGSQLLRDCDRLRGATPAQAASIVKAVGGTLYPTVPPTCAPNEILLDSSQRMSLIQHVDTLFVEPTKTTAQLSRRAAERLS